MHVPVRSLLARAARLPRLAPLAVAALLAACAIPQMPTPIPVPGTGPVVPPPAAGVPRLAGSSWYWIGTATPAGLVTPADPGQFNLEFLDGGQLAAQLDCNRGTATWRQDGGSLRIGPVAGARRACAGGSEAERFSRQLALVRGARTANGLLELDLGETGTMTLARDPDARLRSFDCPDGSAVWVAFVRDLALVRYRGASWQLKQQSTASGPRYAAGNAVLFSKGNDATLIDGGRQLAGPCTWRRG
ncbi:MAG TPA: MliC family protein [Burkholderiaceae bacterium]|nr:MliC family protein [Burkholderiaceae bacterium]